MKNHLTFTFLITSILLYLTIHNHTYTKIINNNSSHIRTSLPLSGHITSYFGYRIHPITCNLDFHPAIDISAPYKTNIHAILPGQVTKIGQSNIYGNYIIILHKNNIKSKYCHCDKILQKLHSHVSKGQIISTVGHTGLATGDHLHLEIKINNINIDPLILIDIK